MKTEDKEEEITTLSENHNYIICNNLYNLFVKYIIKYYVKIDEVSLFREKVIATLVLTFANAIPLIFGILFGSSVSTIYLIVFLIFPLIPIVMGTIFIRNTIIRKKFLQALKKKHFKYAKKYAIKHQELPELKWAIDMIEFLKKGDYSSAYALSRNPRFVEYLRDEVSAFNSKEKIKQFLDKLEECGK